MEECDAETLNSAGASMSKTNIQKSNVYLNGIEQAFQAFGQCFIRKVESRWIADIPIYEGFFSEFPLNTKAGGRRETWSRWKRTEGQTRTFLGGAKKRIPAAIRWALENNLLLAEEAHCLNEIITLLTFPTDAVEDTSWREACLAQCEKVVPTLGYFVELNNGEFFYDPFNEIVLDVYAFQQTKREDARVNVDVAGAVELLESLENNPDRVGMSEVNVGCAALCSALGYLGTVNPSLFDLDLEELSIRFVDLAEGRASSEEIFCDSLTLGQLKSTPFVIDILVRQLKAEGMWLIERMVALTDDSSANPHFKLEDVRRHILDLSRDRLRIAKRQKSFSGC